MTCTFSFYLSGNELYTNLGLAFVAVFLVTLLLVANIWVCLLVCVSVVITLVRNYLFSILLQPCTVFS